MIWILLLKNVKFSHRFKDTEQYLQEEKHGPAGPVGSIDALSEVAVGALRIPAVLKRKQ